MENLTKEQLIPGEIYFHSFDDCKWEYVFIFKSYNSNYISGKYFYETHSKEHMSFPYSNPLESNIRVATHEEQQRLIEGCQAKYPDFKYEGFNNTQYEIY